MQNYSNRRRAHRRSAISNYGTLGGGTMERRKGPLNYFAESEYSGVKVRMDMTTRRKTDLGKNPQKKPLAK